MLPAQREDLAGAGAGKGEKTHGRDYALRLGTSLLSLSKNSTESRKLFAGQKALHFLLGVALDVAAWIRMVRSKAPPLSEIEHLREQGEHPVCRTGRGAHRVMQLCDVGAGNVLHLQTSERGQDVQTQVDLVHPGAARALFRRGVLGEESVCQLGYGRRRSPGPLSSLWIAACGDVGEHRPSDYPRLLSGDRPVGAESGLALLPIGGPVVEQIRAPTLGRDLASEAAQLGVPYNHVPIAGGNTLDHPLSQLRVHGLRPSNCPR